MNNFNQQSYFAPVNGIRSTNNIIWVQGIEGAKAWQLAPNSMAIFLDSENEGKMYIKVTDNIGIGSLRVFNYVEELVQSTQGNVTTNSRNKMAIMNSIIEMIMAIMNVVEIIIIMLCIMMVVIIILIK